jgi:hypothetical protein
MSIFIKIALWDANGLAQPKDETILEHSSIDILLTLLTDPTSRYPIITHSSPITQKTLHSLVLEYTLKCCQLLRIAEIWKKLPTS